MIVSEVTHPQGRQPAVFNPLGHPTPYAYVFLRPTSMLTGCEEFDAGEKGLQQKWLKKKDCSFHPCFVYVWKLRIPSPFMMHRRMVWGVQKVRRWAPLKRP
jgi:hypothetical protein